MTLSSELKIFANRVNSPYESDRRRLEAAGYYSGSILGFSELQRDHADEFVEMVSLDFDRFMKVAADPSEPQSVRLYAMGEAIGNSLSNLAIASSRVRRGRAALLTSREDFISASTPLSKAAANHVQFRCMIHDCLRLAQDEDEHPFIRKGAIILFNKLVVIGNLSFGQTIKRSHYVDIFEMIANTAEDRRLKLCALKLGACAPRFLEPAAS